jgi:hypothetical protein
MVYDCFTHITYLWYLLCLSGLLAAGLNGVSKSTCNILQNKWAGPNIIYTVFWIQTDPVSNLRSQGLRGGSTQLVSRSR